MTGPEQPLPAPDVVLRDRILTALRSVEISAGIRSRIPYSQLADAVLSIGMFDVVLHADGIHLYHSTHCRHGDQNLCDDDSNGRRPAQCKKCGAACRHTYVELQNEGT